MINAVFDACVLYPGSLRDFLLRLAYDGLIVPFWSEEIRDEWFRSLLRNRPNLWEKLERTRRKMDFHFPNSLVDGYETIIPMLQLPDPNDRHVLAVAIHAKAKYIVTFNLKHFPKPALEPYEIEAVSPDEIVLQVIQRRTNRAIETVRNHRAGLTKPSLSATEYLAMLEKQGLPQTVAFLRKHEGAI